jgi:N-acetylmuramoyl-L-alanine amidase
VTCGFYAHQGFESVGGHRLAVLAADAVARCDLAGPIEEPRAMRLPVLRETRMPAVLVEVGPASDVVLRAAALAAALADAVEQWVAAPVDH